MAVIVTEPDNLAQQKSNGQLQPKPNPEQSNSAKFDAPIKPRYPYPVFLIFLTEFCERFSYYGMRAVLTLYMRNVLNFSESLSTTIYHVFLLLCYGLPVIGGILADNYIGKYKTIVFASIIFALGNITLSASSIPPLHLPALPLTLVALLLLAIGTGGVKPCVVALGGEQFELPTQTKKLCHFFAIFQFAVYFGSLVSTIITPVFRKDVSCFGDDTCYPLAFGVPACIMLFAIGVFVSGKKLYKLVKPHGNILVKVVKCISYAATQKLKNRHESKNEEKKTHWLEYAKNKFDDKLISDTKGLTRILIYYLPVPMFWALYEQLGSRWTFQATRMNGVVWNFTIKPDQMQVANAILMFTLIPLSETIIYPAFRKYGFLKRPLQRMGIGGIFAAVSFVLAGIVELQIQNSSYSNIPAPGETTLNLVNTLPCSLSLQTQHSEGFIINPEQNYLIQSIPRETSLNFSLQQLKNETVHPNSCNAFGQLTQLNETAITHEQFQTSVISVQNGSLSFTSLPGSEDLSKSKEAFAKLRLVFNAWSLYDQNLIELPTHIKLTSQKMSKRFLMHPISEDGNLAIFTSSMSEIDHELYTVTLVTKNSEIAVKGTFELKIGGSYLLVITDRGDSILNSQLIILTPPNDIHMLWLLPQYFVIACAEILFIISGMEFSFTEAPKSMKSVLQSCWHLTNAFGNLIVIFAAQFNMNEATGFFTFAGLMTIDTIFFAWLASKYKYVTLVDEPKKEEPMADETEDVETYL